ncbi:MAG TPA: DUF6022 family protein [Phototrophicaceae bacterium]|jgi:hypothetical protein|nr:DUF6022 family protein [Phototrophicaceae bacterium]
MESSSVPPLEAWFAEQQSRDIHSLGRYIQQHVNQHWDSVFQQVQGEMIARYAEIGDSVYGIYGRHLFQHVHEQFKLNGLRATPHLPGNFSISREWGPEDERQRWMWSKIISSDDMTNGTIVTVFFHDHEQLRIPRVFEIIALAAVTKGEVVAALSQLSADFKKAPEARSEYA